MNQPLVPHITEKSYPGTERNTYTFKVGGNLEKPAIKKLVEKLYKVEVVSLQVINLPGKVRRFKGITGKTSPRQKAVVRLAKGQQIPGFEVEQVAKDKE